MKIMIFGNVYNTYTNLINPCRECVLRRSEICSRIPALLCIEFRGGLQPSNTKIFTL